MIRTQNYVLKYSLKNIKAAAHKRKKANLLNVDFHNSNDFIDLGLCLLESFVCGTWTLASGGSTRSSLRLHFEFLKNSKIN